MTPRSDISKCEGGGFECCKTCARLLAPTGYKQNWTVPIENIRGGCEVYADIRKYLHLYDLTVEA